MAACRPSYIGGRRILLLGLVVLLTCVMAALVAAFAQYFTTGVFFSLEQILHHETFEVTIIAFGCGVFITTVGFAAYNHDQKLSLPRYVQVPIPLSYSVSVPPNLSGIDQVTDLSAPCHR